MISECCTAPETERYPSEMGICPCCKDHCVFVDEDAEDTREFSPAQEAQIDALQKSWAEQAVQEAADEAEWLREHEQGVSNDHH